MKLRSQAALGITEASFVLLSLALTLRRYIYVELKNKAYDRKLDFSNSLDRSSNQELLEVRMAWGAGRRIMMMKDGINTLFLTL